MYEKGMEETVLCRNYRIRRYCFVPADDRRNSMADIGDGVLAAAVIWIEYGYIIVLKRRLSELEKQLETEYKNADKLDK